MTKVEKISIALTPQLAEAVRVAVEAGDYASSSEVIREALRAWTEKRAARTEAIERIRTAWDAGIASGIAPRRRTAAEIKADGRRRLGLEA
jgi:antitoxin ParD1/3/4